MVTNQGCRTGYKCLHLMGGGTKVMGTFVIRHLALTFAVCSALFRLMLVAFSGWYQWCYVSYDNENSSFYA
jgi:hypothetical protein